MAERGDLRMKTAGNIVLVFACIFHRMAERGDLKMKTAESIILVFHKMSERGEEERKHKNAL